MKEELNSVRRVFQTKSQCGSHKTDTLSIQNSNGIPLEARCRNRSGPVEIS